jgi:hypothetical protein
MTSIRLQDKRFGHTAVGIPLIPPSPRECFCVVKYVKNTRRVTAIVILRVCFL